MTNGENIYFDPLGAVVWALVIAITVWAATGGLLRVLRQRQILDIPNDRSSHKDPTPRGGGLALVIILGATWLGAKLAFNLLDPSLGWPVLAGFLGLAALSWLDDLRSLGAPVRLAGHLLAVGLALPGIVAGGAVFQGLLPGWLDMVVAGLIWAGFLNFFNFMDGIDGISGVETAAIAGGITVLAVLGSVPSAQGYAGLALVGAAAGFLIWNWAPAKIFLGDVGSVPLGFVLGALLLSLAVSGHWIAALLLPAYYLADAGVTLIRRAARGERIWQAHREHFYQRANQNGMSHNRISSAIAVANTILIILAGLSVVLPTSLFVTLSLLSAGALTVALLMTWMVR